MNLPSKILAVALVAAVPICFGGSAGAAPRGGGGGPGWAGGHAWGGGHWGGGRGWGWGGAAAGLAAGAVIGGAVAASQPWYGYDYDYAPGYYGSGYNNYGYNNYGYSDYGYAAPGGYMAVAPDQDAAYCAQRFRSYDPASGTYLGYDGYRHSCP